MLNCETLRGAGKLFLRVSRLLRDYRLILLFALVFNFSLQADAENLNSDSSQATLNAEQESLLQQITGKVANDSQGAAQVVWEALRSGALPEEQIIPLVQRSDQLQIALCKICAELELGNLKTGNANSDLQQSINKLGLAQCQTELEHLRKLYSDAKSFQGKEDAVAVVALRDFTKSDLEKKFLEEEITVFISQLARKNIEKSQSNIALRQLAEIDLAYRSESVFSIASSAIETTLANLEGQEFWPFADEKVKGLVEQLEASNPQATQSLLAIFTWRVFAALKNQDSEAARQAFDQILLRRPDPSEDNAKLRFELALNAKGPELRAFARSRIDELKLAHQLNYLMRLRLLFSGFYGMFFPVILTLALLIAISSLILPGMGIKFPVFQYLKKIIPEKTIPGYLRPRDGVDEYSRLLHQFGLDDAATDDDANARQRLVQQTRRERERKGK